MIEYPSKVSLSRYIADIFRYRQLLVLLSTKWVKLKYEHSYIGIGWIIINPIITTLVYTIFFGLAFDVDVNRLKYFIFIYSGMLPWLFFRDSFLDILEVFSKEPNTIKRTNFPRIIYPLSSVLLKFVEFSFGLIILVITLLASGRSISPAMFLLPILILEVVMFSIGLGLLFLIPSLIYRDIKHMLRFMLPLGLYSLPIIYNIKHVPANWLRYYTLNPMVSVIQSLRAILFHETVPWVMLYKGMSVSLILFIAGILVFKKYEKKIADLV